MEFWYKALDINEYLPKETLDWRHIELSRIGSDPEKPPAISPAERYTPFRTVYIRLREVISAHFTNGSDPKLALSLAPLGAANWTPNIHIHTAISTEN